MSSSRDTTWLEDLAKLKTASDVVFRAAYKRSAEEVHALAEDSDDSTDEEERFDRSMKRQKLRRTCKAGRELRRLERAERIEQLEEEIGELQSTLFKLIDIQARDSD